MNFDKKEQYFNADFCGRSCLNRRRYRSSATLFCPTALTLLQTGSSSRECQSIMRLVQESAHATTSYWTAARVTRKFHVFSFVNMSTLLLEMDHVYCLTFVYCWWVDFMSRVYLHGLFLFLHECTLFSTANYVGQSALYPQFI